MIKKSQKIFNMPGLLIRNIRNKTENYDIYNYLVKILPYFLDNKEVLFFSFSKKNTQIF